MPDDSEAPGKSDLARTVDLLWGIEAPRGTRGPRPGLSVEAITRAALEIADAEGIAALSMQKVAKLLGYTTMSIYNYVPGKEQLIELMLDAATPPPPVPAEGEDWRVSLERWAAATWELYRLHPWSLKVPTANPPLGPNQLAWFEAALAAIARSGLSGGDVMALGLYVLASVRGQAGLVLDLTGTRDATAPEFAEQMRRIVDSARFPVLHGITMAAPEQAYGTAAIQMDLDFGLRRLMDGVERYVERRVG
ncbi:TetR family transcriptional regulator [Actinorhabdospora filicis]|uniref:TetR family transcriptional regulator n=1 Tax=Actinorhabdospora filicis TaxID=1785913 RepID=A0A9W6SIP2_9ACTN|nr:TetR/AcrR family transcriptional regulator [Actinorhabdospora filicis]GLZ77800.1 TetR family transcriptional regulator [Actinorhabdospora filicis]